MIGRRSVLLGVGAAAALPTGQASAESSWPSVHGQEWTIQSGEHRATVVELGGTLREYTVRGVPLVDPFPLDSTLKSASRIMAPWPNRLEDASYTFEGTQHSLPMNDLNRRTAIHGLVRWLPWRQVRRTRASITLSCLLAPQPGYPFALELRTRWTVGGSGLQVEHSAVNRGAAAAPFGLGTHPFLRLGDAVINDLLLHVPATEFLVTDDRLLPIGRKPVAGTPYDFTTPTRVGEVAMDLTYTSLRRAADGLARISLGPGVTLWQDEAFGWVQVFSGTGPSGRPRGALAVEPMSCPPNAFRSGEGLVTLRPGARWSGCWGVSQS